MADYSLDALHCDKCVLNDSSGCNADTGNNCLWIPKNNDLHGECSHKCKARLTKGECDQYQEWNKSELSPVIYDFSGSSNDCIWHPNDYSMDETHSSTEGVCRAKDSKCFDTTPTPAEAADTSLGEVYCGYYYGGHDKECYNYTADTCISEGHDNCKLYTDPRMDEFSGAEFSGTGSINKGYCISDGKIRYDLETGEELGLIKTDEECSQIKEAENCIGEIGNGCLWEPVKQYCIPKVPQPNVPKPDGSAVTNKDMYDSCKPIDGHLPGNYDLNLLEEEGINVSEYRDRDNKKFPYYTSKYLCDVCNIRDNDLDNMYELNQIAAGGNPEEAQNTLNYYMLKDYVDFGDGATFERSSTQSLSPQEYCEKVIDDTYDIFNPCIWDDTDTSAKGGNCVSKCSQHSPVDSSVATSRDLESHKGECLSERWFPEESVRDIQFPNLNRGAETTEDYFNDRYCTWDGYECHNSIPCKFAQQTRCEDLGYDWYEGTAVDIMSQPNASTRFGIPVDLSSSYPIVRKGDGKPVEGDMEGVCIYPNVEAGFISQPETYIINPKYVGEQVIMIKWREYGSGWWEDNSCKRKINELKIDAIDNTDDTNVNNPLNTRSYFLGENIALIPFRIEQGDKCADIKLAINNALQSYQYFVYNGEWVVYAEDVVHAIERSYDSSIDEPSNTGISAEDIYKKYYGYLYYTEYDDYSTINSEPSIDDNERKILNSIYDLRGAINILPVVNGQCRLEITNFNIDSNSGDMTLTVEPTNNNTKFEFVEFIGTDIFTESANAVGDDSDPIIAEKLTLNVLSKYNYDGTNSAHLPGNTVEGYGTLYENKMVKDIEANDLINYNFTHEMYETFMGLTNTFISQLNDIKTGLPSETQGIINIIISNRPTSEESNQLNIFDISIADSITIQQSIDENNGHLEEWINILKTNLALDTVSVNNLIKEYISDVEKLKHKTKFDIRNIGEFTALQGLIRRFIPGTVESGGFAYTDEYKNWAAYVEFKNFNVFSQPIIEIKSELNKAKCKHAGSDDSVYLCSGSLESWKINNDVTIPTYQAINLASVDGLLKLMARYLDQDTLFVNGIAPTKDDGGSYSNLQEYIDSYQKTDITKCVVWSITRNTPPFWGNLFYNKHDIVAGVSDDNQVTDLYTCSGNYNTLDHDTDYTDVIYKKACYGKEDFQHGLGENTLIKPFGELGGVENQTILWKNIMSYTGGNKREIQLSRNVKNDDFNAYIEYRNNNGDTNLNRNYYDTTGGGGVLPVDQDETPYYMGLPYDDLKNEIEQLSPIIALSKRDYLIRSLNDWKRISYTYPVSGNIYSIPNYGSSTLHDSAVDFINSSNTDNSTTYDSDLPVSVEPITYQTNLNDFINNVDNAKYTKLDELLLAPVHTGTGKGGQGVRQNCHDKYYGELGGITSAAHNLIGSADNRMRVHHSGQDDTNLNSDRNAPKSDYIWENEATRCNDPLWDTSGLTTTITPNTNQNYLSCCQAVSHNDLTLSPASTSDSNPFKFPRGGNTFTWDGDIDPSIYNKNIESLYRLTNIEKPSEVTNNTDDTDGILKAWGKITDGISHTEDLDTMWSQFNEIESDNDTIINKLIYDDNTNITVNSINSDKLRKWCMSTSDSLDSSNFNKKTSNFDISNNINPNNPENQMGILYSNWLNTEDNINNYKVNVDDDEFFSDNKNYNAYNYPSICEPWLLKVRDTGSSYSDNAYYTDSIINWNNYHVFDPFNRSDLPDFSIINNVSGNGGKWTYSVDGETANITDDSNVFGLNNQGTVTFDDFSRNTIVIDKNQLISEDYDGTQPVHNNLYNMLHPLSITAARPREKVIYIDITPNNDIFSDDQNNINTIYFDTNEEYNYDTNNNYFLKPGISMILNNPASTYNYKFIVGINSGTVGATDILTYTDTPNLEYIANHHVAYFKKIHSLLIPKDANGIYKFDSGIISTSYNSMKYSATAGDTGGDTGGVAAGAADGVAIFYYKPLAESELFNKEYYQHRLPQKASITKSIKSDLFGTGLSYPLQEPLGSSNEEITTLQNYDFATLGSMTDRPIIKYFNINMRFNSERSRATNDELIEQIEICKDIVRSKLSRCGNPNNWDTQNKSGCNTCFGANDGDETTSMCSGYGSYIEGSGGTDLSEGLNAGNINMDNVGVCDILDYNRDNSRPWDYIDVVQEPENYGMNLPANSPYDHDNRTCDNIDNTDIDYIPLYHAGVNTENNDTGTVFFKNVRNNVSDIFESSVSDPRPYGCIRKDLSLMDVDNIKLSCNTQLASAVERDKHVLINYIIQHSTELNTSERTKLAIMSYEELLNKALSLELSGETGELLNIGDINDFTRPKVYKKQRDVKIDNICEISGDFCERDDDCGVGEQCGRYEQWNDLQNYYYNIDNGGPLSKGFTMRKEWYMGGCGIDLNYSDSSSGESICKDKYPGLCEKNVEKCSSDNTAVREAIMLDCPETCQVQYTDFDRYKTNQIGELSICTARGRCKWSQDPDESNLLPICEEHTSREMGSVEKCRKYNLGPGDGGPDSGSCNLDDYPQTLGSPICAEQRCTSMQGCLFTKPKTRYCRVESYVDDRIVNEEDCPGGSRWIGTSPGGQCIMPYKEFYDSDLQDFEQDCSILGGTMIDGQEQSCEYIPDLPYTGEDPCTHLVDLDDLTEDEQRLYLFATKGGPIYIEKITPESFDGEEKDHPDYIKITLNTTLGNANINDFVNLGITEFPRDKYIYIDNNTTDNNSTCSQYLLGKSKIVKIANNNGKTEIIIGGPNKAYILPRHTEDSPDGSYEMGDIDIGGTNACELMGIYDIETYFTNNTNDADTRSAGQRKSDACYYNPRGACNYETSSDGSSGDCVSCALYEDEVSCFGNNDTNEYSRCGWGSIKDMCEVIGEMDECKKMHIDGCEWDPAKETCSLNKLTDDDGLPLVDKVGCVKCDDIGHRNTCNSMKNCFWDRLTKTDDDVGRCRACSNIGDPTNESTDSNKGVNVPELTDTLDQCDEYQLTEGQCEFRNPENRVSGLDTDLHIFSSEFGDMNSISGKILNSWKIIFDDVTGQANEKLDDNECLDDDVQCKCSPTRLYPLFPDWIIHNLIFLLIFGPFIAYFGYAWYKVLISPCVFDLELETIEDSIEEVSKPDVSELLETLTEGIAKKLKEEVKEGAKETVSAVEEAVEEATKTIKGGSNKIGSRYKQDGMESEFNLLDAVSSDPGTEFSIKVGNELKTYNVKGIIEVLGDLFSTKGESSKYKEIYTNNKEKIINLPTKIFNETINPMMRFSKGDWFKAQYHYLIPTTDRNTPMMCAPLRDWRNLNGIFEKARILLYVPFLFMNPIRFLKLLFVIISFPFTLLQILANNVRLSIPVRVASIVGWFKGLIVDLVKLIPLGPITIIPIIILWIIIIALLIGMTASLVIVTVILVKYGITCFLELSKTGVLPNKNYVDPIDGITHKDENSDKIYPAAAVWPRRLYREEWDDMIKDPISDEVVQQRESLLPDILQGSINDKDNVTDAYKIAYMELEPESLNWTQSLRNMGTHYNNFVNRLGDNLLFTFILAPYIIYKYITTVSDYFPKEGEVFQIKDVLVYTVLYAVIFGIVSVIMTRSEPADNEYDGVEKKCYDDIPSPFSLGGGSPINYPKVCYGDSLDEDKNECPYGCYYIGDGTANPKKCKDNRSGLSLGGFLEPEPRLNLPFPEDGNIDDESNGEWYRPDGKEYACPPKSRFLGKYPYDSLCATTAKRCKAADSLNNLVIDSDDFCESLYMLNNHDDTKCNNNFIDGEMTQSGYSSKSDELARGPITENGIEPAVRCELHTPYTSGEGYSTDKFCPFPLPAGENVLYSQSSDPEDNLRSSIPLWTNLYDKITNRTTPETCTYLCENPGNCTLAENTYTDYCNNVDMYSDSSKTPEEICITPSTDGRNCRYFPENIPLQMSMQNQERYYIVNQEYGQNLFS